jgi:hypothetical protein
VRVIHHEQGSEGWRRSRLGLPTCSAYDRILTSSKLQRSTQAGLYGDQLLTEWLTGSPIDWSGAGTYGFTDRGREMEAEARSWYELDRSVDVQTVGFILRDDGQTGGSPDGLVGTEGGIEIKVPALHTMVGYLRNPASLAAAYKHQVQGYLHVTGREWWDLVAYHPVLPAVVLRVEPDPAYQEALERELRWFCSWLAEGKEMLAPYRAEPAGVIPGTVEDLLERSLAEIAS